MAVAEQIAVYKLSAILDDPRFDGFDFARGVKSLLGNDFPIEDFQGEDPLMFSWKPASLAEVWKPPKVVGNVRPFNDYPCLGLTKPAFSERAVKCLRPMLEANGELLPLDSDLGSYWVFNVQTKCFALDVNRSKIAWWGADCDAAIDVKWFAFNQKKLRGLAIFKLREYPIEVFVTQVFRDRVEECGLNGFHFIKVWPYPRGVYWNDEEVKARRARAKKKGDLRGETLILRFRLAGPKPNAAENRMIKRFTEELRADLSAQSTPTAPYYGSLETTELTRGEWRVFFSCGSVDKLIEHLEGWIDGNPWPGQLHIVKRRGHLLDRTAKEERIAIK
jgi:hypothetical protein